MMTPIKPDEQHHERNFSYPNASPLLGFPGKRNNDNERMAPMIGLMETSKFGQS